MPGPAIPENRHATRWIADQLAQLGNGLRVDEGASEAEVELVGMAVQRLRDLNAVAARAYMNVPPYGGICNVCHQGIEHRNRLHRSWVALQVRTAKLERKLVLRAARLGRERARHAEVVRELEAASLDRDLQLAAGRKLALEMMNTPGQGLLGALVYRTLGGNTNVQQ